MECRLKPLIPSYINMSVVCMQNCENSFVRQMFVLVSVRSTYCTCKRALYRMCDSKRGQSYRASTRNFQHVCVNECMCVRIYVCKRVSIRI
jgi:hypothetical protein